MERVYFGEIIVFITDMQSLGVYILKNCLSLIQIPKYSSISNIIFVYVILSIFEFSKFLSTSKPSTWKST